MLLLSDFVNKFKTTVSGQNRGRFEEFGLQFISREKNVGASRLPPCSLTIYHADGNRVARVFTAAFLFCRRNLKNRCSYAQQT